MSMNIGMKRRFDAKLQQNLVSLRDEMIMKKKEEIKADLEKKVKEHAVNIIMERSKVIDYVDEVCEAFVNSAKEKFKFSKPSEQATLASLIRNEELTFHFYFLPQFSALIEKVIGPEN